MPFPQNMVYLRFEFGWRPSGQPSDVEIQDFGLWGIVEQEGISAFDAWQPLVDAIAAQGVSAFLANFLPGQFSQNVYGRRAIAYHYDQAHQEVLHRGEAVFAGATAFQGSGDTFPPQISVAVSTQAYAVGEFATQARSKRGRFYLPSPTRAGTAADGEMSSSAQTQYLTSAVGFINDVSDVLDVAGEPTGDETHFFPGVNSPTYSMFNKIQSVRVGRIFDTQRRRRNKLGEAYVAGPVG